MKGNLKFDIEPANESCSSTIEVIMFWDNFDEMEFIRQGFLSIDDAVDYIVACSVVLEDLVDEKVPESNQDIYDIVLSDLEKVKVVSQIVGADGKARWELNPEIEDVGCMYDSEIVSRVLLKRQDSVMSDISQTSKEVLRSNSILKLFF